MKKHKAQGSALILLLWGELVQFSRSITLVSLGQKHLSQRPILGFPSKVDHTSSLHETLDDFFKMLLQTFSNYSTNCIMPFAGFSLMFVYKVSNFFCSFK